MKRIKKPEESSTRSTRKYSEVYSVSRLFTDGAISQYLKKQTEAFLRRITKVNGHSYLFLTRRIRRNRHAGCSYERGRKIDENQWIGLSYLPPEHKSHAPKQTMTAEKEIIPFGHHRSILQLLLHVKIYLCCLLFQQRGAIVDSDEIEYFYEFHYLFPLSLDALNRFFLSEFFLSVYYLHSLANIQNFHQSVGIV